MTAFPERLKFLRTRKGITQQELADIVGVSRTAIAGYERLDKQPNFDVLVKISNFFNVTTDYLLGLSNSEVEKDSKDYFANRIDKLFDDVKEFKQYGFSDSSSFAKYLYQIVMKSFDYDIDYAVSDTAFQFEIFFLEIFKLIDRTNDTFDKVNYDSSGLDKRKLKSDFFKANSLRIVNDVQSAMEEFIGYCCKLIEEQTLFNHNRKI